MAFTYNNDELTLAGVTRYPEVEAQLAEMDDTNGTNTDIEAFLEYIAANRYGTGTAITTEINTAAEYNALIAAWGGYRNIKK